MDGFFWRSVESLTFVGIVGMSGPSPDAVVRWFGVLDLINMQMGFLSPPFGYALFYICGVAPPAISMATIFRSSLVFLAIQVQALFLVVVLPVRHRATGAGLWALLDQSGQQRPVAPDVAQRRIAVADDETAQVGACQAVA